MASPTENQPAGVPRANQAGEEIVRGRWAWTKPRGWTDRMLTALQTGVNGGLWFSPIVKVTAERALCSAAPRMTSRPGKAAGGNHVPPEHWMRPNGTSGSQGGAVERNRLFLLLS